MNNQVVSVMRDYLKPANISVEKLPIRIDFEDSTYINIEIVKEKLLIVYSTNIDENALKDQVKELLEKCYYKNQKTYLMKLGIHSSNKLCFNISLSIEQITLPAINEIMNQLLSLKDSLL